MGCTENLNFPEEVYTRCPLLYCVNPTAALSGGGGGGGGGGGRGGTNIRENKGGPNKNKFKRNKGVMIYCRNYHQ